VDIEHDADITHLGTLGTPARARMLVHAADERTLAHAVAMALRDGLPWFVLGGGSNVVLPEAFPGLVIRMALRGVREITSAGEGVALAVAAGEPWHELVRRSLGAGLQGLEAMALIPGTVGAAPVQNIGAYGGELADVFVHARVLHAASGELETWSHARCAFRYRDSVFKGLGDSALITEVGLQLQRGAPPQARYPEVLAELQRLGHAVPTPAQYAEAVIRVRRRKLPDVRRHGNVGSFFHNPLLLPAAADELCARWPELARMRRDEQTPEGLRVKLPAAALIERAGWKGRVDGPVEAWRRQPLVLVNRGGARRADVLATAARIQDDVRVRFGVLLQVEPRLAFPGLRA
jgi:UDP-N-acetylmuramate dehydrogenase